MKEAKRTIVVGVDGAEAGAAALRWAVRQAARDGSVVKAVAVRQPVLVAPATSLAFQPHGTRTVPDEHLAERLRDAVESARQGMVDPPEIIEVMVTGDPATELARQSVGADVLVVGSHEHGPLAEVFLGSVASDVLRHAECPVTVINKAARV